MVEYIDNGRVVSWKPSDDTHDRYIKLYNFNNYQEFPQQFEEELNPANLKFQCNGWEQFTILFRRVSKQIYRNTVNIDQQKMKKFIIQSHSRVIYRFDSTCTSSLVL